MIFIVSILLFLFFMGTVMQKRDLEFSKETMMNFADECIALHKSINMSKTSKEVESMMKNQFIKLREKYKNDVPKKVFSSRLGELYAHGYNRIFKNK